MGGAGKYGEPGAGKRASQIAGNAAPEEAEQLHRVLWPDDVGITNNHQRWCGDPRDVFLRPGIIPGQDLLLLDEYREVLRVRRVAQVRGLLWRPDEDVRGHHLEAH